VTAKGRAKTRAGVGPTGRRPKTEAAPAGSTAQDCPLFCFRYADRASDHTWAFKPLETHAERLFDFICDMAQLTWGEIESMRTGSGHKRHRKHHDQEMTSVCDDAQADLARLKLGETFGGDLFRFRLAGEQRLWGVRSGRTFHIVWWDAGHDVYKQEPKRR
jgi:hypothetical protein